MIFKEIEYKDNSSEFDWEEVPQVELWEDGELNTVQVQHKILNHTIQQGDWILIRKVK